MTSAGDVVDWSVPCYITFLVKLLFSLLVAFYFLLNDSPLLRHADAELLFLPPSCVHKDEAFLRCKNATITSECEVHGKGPNYDEWPFSSTTFCRISQFCKETVDLSGSSS